MTKRNKPRKKGCSGMGVKKKCGEQWYPAVERLLLNIQYFTDNAGEVGITLTPAQVGWKVF